MVCPICNQRQATNAEFFDVFSNDTINVCEECGKWLREKNVRQYYTGISTRWGNMHKDKFSALNKAIDQFYSNPANEETRW